MKSESVTREEEKRKRYSKSEKDSDNIPRKKNRKKDGKRGSNEQLSNYSALVCMRVGTFCGHHSSFEDIEGVAHH